MEVVEAVAAASVTDDSPSLSPFLTPLLLTPAHPGSAENEDTETTLSPPEAGPGNDS